VNKKFVEDLCVTSYVSRSIRKAPLLQQKVCFCVLEVVKTVGKSKSDPSLLNLM
jgi:hypothetical protein